MAIWLKFECGHKRIVVNHIGEEYLKSKKGYCDRCKDYKATADNSDFKTASPKLKHS